MPTVAPGQLGVQVFAPGNGIPVVEGTEAGATVRAAPLTSAALSGEEIPPSVSIPIFIFGFFFVVFAIYLAKKMKLIKQDIVNKQHVSQME